MDRPAIVVAAALLVLAGCGAGTTSAPSAAPATPVVTPAPATPIVTQAPSTAGPTPSPPSPLPDARCPEVPNPTGTVCVTIAIRDFAFDPPLVTIPARARVVFVNEDGAPHSIAWADGTQSSPTLARGGSAERTLSDAPSGTLDYTCGIHGARMSGRIVVDASLPVP